MSITGDDELKKFLPVNKKDLNNSGWKECDFIIISGDAYVDHPSFGSAIISRILEKEGFRVGIISQPDWTNPDSVKILGRPRLAFLLTSGNMDSMVSNYSSSLRKRKNDSYSPGGIPGRRPDRALIVYTSLVKAAFKGVPVVIGGIEASLRRLSHYDYWSDKIRRSVLIDTKADLLVYGMAERQITELGKRLSAGIQIGEIRDIPGTVVKLSEKDFSYYAGTADNLLQLPEYQDILKDKNKFAESFRIQYENTNPFSASILAEKTDTQWVIQNPPQKPLSTEELDAVYNLPFTRKYHHMYEKDGGIPALKEVEFSLAVNRGCFGACSFCALVFHQGRIVQARSIESIISEAEHMVQNPEFKGIIHDAGGPTANFFHASCKKQEKHGSCPDRECLFPEPCPNLDTDHTEYLRLLRRLRKLPEIKRVFIRSGIRFDYLMEAVKRENKLNKTSGEEFFSDLCKYHVSGQLKTAPEHVSAGVLNLMRKPGNRVYREFEDKFREINKIEGKKQYIIPYLISGHPGSGLKEAIELAVYLKKQKFIPDQVQDFYPTPSTISTCMYYSGINPLNGKKVYTAKTPQEKAMQRALLHFHKPENRKLVIKALKEVGRTDLIGSGKNCLIR